jgi:site-specific DNA-cytosine methylase
MSCNKEWNDDFLDTSFPKSFLNKEYKNHIEGIEFAKQEALMPQTMVVLENVRNIAGPRHAHEWKYIIEKLRDLGYRVSSKPFVVSPHRIPPSYGGTPQARERVFIVGTRLPSKRHRSPPRDPRRLIEACHRSA